MPLSAQCPLCRKPTDARFDPFCSQACKTLDLHRWLTGVYSIPTNEAPETPEPSADVSDE